ncbi:MAG: hypothetical protein HY057_10660 [Rhodospirillales bacterium]|nr:hypothetical protein [Rhodospirillales bacterium]
MGRILFQFVLPIVLPTAIYLLWLAAERRRIERGGAGEKPRWQDTPWVWLAALGLVFAGLIAVAIAVFGGDMTEGRYVPPQLKDGEIVPGHVEPAAPRR